MVYRLVISEITAVMFEETYQSQWSIKGGMRTSNCFFKKVRSFYKYFLNKNAPRLGVRWCGQKQYTRVLLYGLIWLSRPPFHDLISRLASQASCTESYTDNKLIQSNLCTTTTLGTKKKWSLFWGGRYSEGQSVKL